MKVWSFCIAARRGDEDPPCGFVRASSLAEALELVGHPHANVYPCMDDVDLLDEAGLVHEQPARRSRTLRFI